MVLDWNARTLQWYADAEEYTGFFRALAAEIAPAVAGVQTLCDLGCGPGLFDFEIAPLVKSVACADTSEAALAFVGERAQALGLHNIFPVLADCEHLSGRWDVIFMSFFGSRHIDRYLPLCRKLIAVVSQSSDAALFPGRGRGYVRNTAQNTAEYLDSRRIAYELVWKRQEFGQPFSSLEEARDYVKLYAPDVCTEEAELFLKQRIVKTESPAFPWYLPRKKTVGIFFINGGLQ